MSEPDFKQFALDVIDMALRDPDNETIADIVQLALKSGLIETVIKDAPCGDDCVCAELNEPPYECYKFGLWYLVGGE